MQSSLDELNIPLHTITHTPRRTIPERVTGLLKEWGATTLFGNISYEVDELRRDIRTCELFKARKMQAVFIQDKLIVNPGTLSTKDGRQYAVRTVLACQGSLF
jgi:deoxyribodipyrimidine photo-lyase